MLARVVEGVVDHPLLSGNRIDPLINGGEAFPAMLEAIQNAHQTVSFVTYIFDRDDVAIAFAEALGEAAKRQAVSAELYSAASAKTRADHGSAGGQPGPQAEAGGAPKRGKKDEGRIIDAEVADEGKAA